VSEPSSTPGLTGSAVEPIVTPPSVPTPILWVLGVILTLLLGFLAWPFLPLPGEIRWGPLFAGLLLGFLGRGVRRKIALHPELSWHQALSFEIVVQVAHLMGPWVPSRAFESAFLQRETGMPEHRANQWLNSRVIGTRAVLFAGMGAIAWTHGWPGATLVLGLIAVLALALGAVNRRVPALGVVAALAGLLFWGAEAWGFASGFGGWLSLPHAVTGYLLLTGALEYTPIPLGLGFPYLPALALWPVFPALFPALVIWHLLRLTLLGLGSILYLPRYKIAPGDLGNPLTITLMRQRLRPADGWRNPAPLPPGAPKVSIVIPAYNEEERLPGFLATVRDYLARRSDIPMEVLVVDDGSRDRTAALVEETATGFPALRLVRQVPNQGKGAAVRRGILEAAGEFILFADADGATPIAELDRLLPATERAEIVIGSRKARSAEVVRQREGLRDLMGNVFYTLVNLFAVPGIRDTQCGFKMFRRDAARRLFSIAEEKGWAFDVEVLFLAQLVGYSIAEVAVNWQAIEGSKVNPFRDAIKMFAAIFRIRRRHSGFCNDPAPGA